MTVGGEELQVPSPGGLSCSRWLSPGSPVPCTHRVSVPGSCSATQGILAVTLGDTTGPPFWACVCGINVIVLMSASIFSYACLAQHPDSPWGGEEVLGEGKNEDLGAVFYLFGM